MSGFACLGIILLLVSVFLLAWWERRDAAQCTNHNLRHFEHHNHDADHKGEGLLMLSLRNECFRSSAIFIGHELWCIFFSIWPLHFLRGWKEESQKPESKRGLWSLATLKLTTIRYSVLRSEIFDWFYVLLMIYLMLLYCVAQVTTNY